jgi:hypothetical protein
MTLLSAILSGQPDKRLVIPLSDIVETGRGTITMWEDLENRYYQLGE